MDVLGDDGRFSQADIDALAGVVGTGSATDASYTDHWDFDSNGEIEQYDVDFMQRLVDLGLGSGLLGDYNRDEVVDCDDFHAMGSGWNYTIGDANYRVEIDADLDGDNDSTDYDTIYELLQPADVNNDGSVNTQDFSAFLSLYNAQDPAADVNGDGSVNTQDYILFLNLWNNPC